MGEERLKELKQYKNLFGNTRSHYLCIAIKLRPYPQCIHERIIVTCKDTSTFVEVLRKQYWAPSFRKHLAPSLIEFCSPSIVIWKACSAEDRAWMIIVWPGGMLSGLLKDAGGIFMRPDCRRPRVSTVVISIAYREPSAIGSLSNPGGHVRVLPSKATLKPLLAGLGSDLRLCFGRGDGERVRSGISGSTTSDRGGVICAVRVGVVGGVVGAISGGVGDIRGGVVCASCSGVAVASPSEIGTIVSNCLYAIHTPLTPGTQLPGIFCKTHRSLSQGRSRGSLVRFGYLEPLPRKRRP